MGAGDGAYALSLGVGNTSSNPFTPLFHFWKPTISGPVLSVNYEPKFGSRAHSAFSTRDSTTGDATITSAKEKGAGHIALAY